MYQRVQQGKHPSRPAERFVDQWPCTAEWDPDDLRTAARPRHAAQYEEAEAPCEAEVLTTTEEVRTLLATLRAFPGYTSPETEYDRVVREEDERRRAAVRRLELMAASDLTDDSGTEDSSSTEDAD